MNRISSGRSAHLRFNDVIGWGGESADLRRRLIGDDVQPWLEQHLKIAVKALARDKTRGQAREALRALKKRCRRRGAR